MAAKDSVIVPGRALGIDPWAAGLQEISARPEMIRPHFQPLVDLERGTVAGYEMLARFDHPLGGSPAEWFEAATLLGAADELDRVIIGLARRAVRGLPPNTFLSVNVTGAGAISERVLESVRHGPSLAPLVIEITEQAEIDDAERLGAAAAEFRERGAMLAIDDAGAGYASLQRILHVRPQFIKLDRSLIADIHVDDAKAAATEMMGSLASRIDAWIVAEGIERVGELERLLQMRVPLGQGYLFAKPAPRFETVDASWGERGRDSVENQGSLIAILDRLHPLQDAAGREEIGWRFDDDPTLDHLPVIDYESKVIGLIDREEFAGGDDCRVEPMRVGPTAAPSDVLRRAMTRPRAERLTPIVCCDEFGRYLGIVRIERLVDAVTGD